MVHGVLLLQRRLSDIVDMAYHEDIVPIIHVASTCELSDLLNRCIQKVAISALDNYLEKQIPGDIYSNIEGLRRFAFIDEIDYFIRGLIMRTRLEESTGPWILTTLALLTGSYKNLQSH
jgi:hypothetical protein